nr:ATP-binding protein [Streptomyces sp. Ru73]
MKIVRRIVGERLRSWHVSEEVCDDALLLTSELVTNVVIHARGTRFLCGFGLVADGRLRIEVHDQGSVRGGPIRRSAGPDCESGRGLYLVQELAADWGTVPSARTGGNMVWATLRTAAF